MTKHMKKFSLKKMTIAAVGNAHSLKGGNESDTCSNNIESDACETKENCIATVLIVSTCTETTPGTTTPNNTLIKTKRTCPIGVV